MFRSRNKQKTIERATEYASCKDFKQIFTEDMVGLHRLAFLLTADHAKAEQCFVAGLEDSIHGNPCFSAMGAGVEQAGHYSECYQSRCTHACTPRCSPGNF